LWSFLVLVTYDIIYRYNHFFFLIKIWNHPTETTIKKWMFRVPGIYNTIYI